LSQSHCAGLEYTLDQELISSHVVSESKKADIKILSQLDPDRLLFDGDREIAVIMVNDFQVVTGTCRE